MEHDTKTRKLPSLHLLTATGAIDDFYRSISKCDDAAKQDEGKKIVEELVCLKYELQLDRNLTSVSPGYLGGILRVDPYQTYTRRRRGQRNPVQP
ncbi:Uu.00g135000.m01.CDS01 [Anthostomella pinea]|uniref:Uu.00g135000.m01.CDS01 n=1 Tax=Anthostomella pinea TaxID=933095 RepID=A0AAI8VP43_9PEZI|nr:Uu.00g135000.m01.CDS01 [Anthostomella pinea]